MSSLYVRDTIKQFITDNAPTEKIIDLSFQFEEMHQLLDSNGASIDGPWLGIEFIPSDDIPITVPATNSQGRFRETGIIYLHVVEVARIGIGSIILTRGEALRDLFRSERIGSIIIDSVSPLTDRAGGTLEFESGFMSGSFILSYQRDLEL